MTRPATPTPSELTQWRERHSFTKTDAAMRTGTHWNSWTAWEQGVRPPPPWVRLVINAVDAGVA